MAATPLFFGDSDRKLYGVFHHPTKRRPAAPAVLLLSPFGEEAIRSNRIFRQLAERLSRAGAPVLRFDYYGSGDSAGDCTELDFAGMAHDAETAQEELAAMTGARRFAWIGLGLGGAVALSAGLEVDVKPSQLFLWDPVLRGADYLADLRGAHIGFLSQALDLPAARVSRDVPKSPAPLREALGFSVSERLHAQLMKLEFKAGKKIARELHLVGTRDDGAGDAAAQILRPATAHFHHYSDASIAWNSNEAMNAHYVPTDVIEYFVDAISVQA